VEQALLPGHSLDECPLGHSVAVVDEDEARLPERVDALRQGEHTILTPRLVGEVPEPPAPDGLVRDPHAAVKVDLRDAEVASEVICDLILSLTEVGDRRGGRKPRVDLDHPAADEIEADDAHQQGLLDSGQLGTQCVGGGHLLTLEPQSPSAAHEPSRVVNGLAMDLEDVEGSIAAKVRGDPVRRPWEELLDLKPARQLVAPREPVDMSLDEIQRGTAAMTVEADAGRSARRLEHV
jgi:hypothetical protein